MLAVIALFDEEKGDYRLGGDALAQVVAAFGDLKAALTDVKTVVTYRAGRKNAQSPAVARPLKNFRLTAQALVLRLGSEKALAVSSGAVGDAVYREAREKGWLGETGHAPQLVLMPRPRMRALCKKVKKDVRLAALMSKGDYKGACMLFAPLGRVKDDPQTWNSADRLYRLGLACSRLATTLLVKASETERLKEARRYRDFCVAFLKRRGAGAKQCALRHSAGIPLLFQRA